MEMSNFDPGILVETYYRNLPFILAQELENNVPLNYMDEKGKYVFLYMDGTILPADIRLSFNENWDNHKQIMWEKWEKC